MGATRCAIYVRISQDRDGEGQGVQRQEQDCRDLAASLGWIVHKVYADNNLSAYSGKVRPEYEALLRDVEAGTVNGILAWHPDRLHRSPLELEHFITLVEAKGVDIHTVQSGQYDLASPSGRAVARTVGAWARYESEHKGRRIRRAREQQAKAGGFHGGVRPFGFEPDGTTVRQSEAVEVRAAAESIIQGMSLRSLVRDLNVRKVPTASGRGSWTSNALREILLRPRVAGLSSWHGEIVGKAKWPALVPEDEWRAVTAILTNPARRTNQRGGTVKWLGSGIYWCGVCHQQTLRAGVTGTKGRHTYRCGNRASTEQSGHVTRESRSVDAYVEAVLVARLSLPGVVEKLLTPTELTTDSDALRTERTGIEARLDELAALHAVGDITARQLATGSEMLRKRWEEIDQTLAAEVQTGPFVDLVDTSDVARLWFGEAEDRSDGLPLAKRRAILDALLTVTVEPAPRGPVFNPEYVTLEWKL